MFNELYDKKKQLYSKYQVNETSYLLKSASDKGHRKITFFDAFGNVNAFRNQLASPILIPLLGAYVTAKELALTAVKLTSGLLRLGLLDTRGLGDVMKGARHFVSALYFAITSVIDALRETVSLITRTSASLYEKGKQLAAHMKRENSCRFSSTSNEYDASASYSEHYSARY